MTTYTFDDFVRDHADIIERMSPGSLASVASGVPFTRGGPGPYASALP
jgi:hypothetical protein